MVIISHKHKFIYIKTRKTASTSLQVLLANYCGKEDIITPIKDPSTEDGILYNKKAKNYRGLLSYLFLLKYRFLNFVSTTNHKVFFNKIKNFLVNRHYLENLKGFFSNFTSHMSARKVKMKVGEGLWNKYFKFTFERNPWDKLVSFYMHRKPGIPFDDWVRTVKLSPYSQPLNYPLYTINGKIVLNFIGTYENLEKDLKLIFNTLKLPLKELPSERTNYRKEKSNYRKYYNNQSKKIVERNYNKEIKLFGYTF
ncbi:MAG: sulfotransferase family 2 domain-containing protein [Promethearchaeota archaeon]